MASRCGWWRLCAIFSGRMCTSQNSTMPPIGTKMMTNHARYIAAASIISGGRNDACAGGGRAMVTTASAVAPMVARNSGEDVRNFIEDGPPLLSGPQTQRLATSLPFETAEFRRMAARKPQEIQPAISYTKDANSHLAGPAPPSRRDRLPLVMGLFGRPDGLH